MPLMTLKMLHRSQSLEKITSGQVIRKSDSPTPLPAAKAMWPRTSFPGLCSESINLPTASLAGVLHWPNHFLSGDPQSSFPAGSRNQVSIRSSGQLVPHDVSYFMVLTFHPFLGCSSQLYKRKHYEAETVVHFT